MSPICSRKIVQYGIDCCQQEVVRIDNTFLIEMGKRIQEKRKSLRLSQEELAEMAEISKQTVSRAENAQRELGAQNVKRLAKALGTSTDYLLTGDRTDADLRILDDKLKDLTSHQYRYLEEFVRIFVEMSKDGSV